MLADSGLRFTTHCRGGFFTIPEGPARRAAIDDNRRAIEETATLAAAGAPGSTAVLVLVAGGLPEGSRDLVGARERVRDALGELAPDAAAAGVTLAIEPLHPMYVSDRAVVSTLGQALDLAADFDRVDRRRDGRHVPRLLGPAGARADRARRPRGPHRDLPGVRLEDAARRRRAALAPLPGRRRDRLRVAHARPCSRRPDTTATSRSRSSTRTCGRPSPARPCAAPRQGFGAAVSPMAGGDRRLGLMTDTSLDSAPAGSRASAPTLHDVAAAAGVSLATASRVLNGSTRKVAESYRDRVQAAADRARLHRQSLRAGDRQGHVGDHRAARRRHRRPVLRPARRRASRAAPTRRDSSSRSPSPSATRRARCGSSGRCAASVRAGSSSRHPAAPDPTHPNCSTRSTRSRGRAGASSRSAPAPAMSARSSSTTRAGRGQLGAALAAARLPQRRHRRARRRACAPPTTASPASPTASRSGGGSIDRVYRGAFTRDAGEAAMRQALADGIPSGTLVFAISDVVAIGALTAIREAGREVGSDIALAGFDDIPTARDVTPRAHDRARPARGRRLRDAPCRRRRRVAARPGRHPTRGAPAGEHTRALTAA